MNNSTLTGLLVDELDLIPGEVAVDNGRCELLGSLALVIQAVMGALVLGSLVIKRAREDTKRPWRIWFADVSKQVLGQAFIHGSNLLISGAAAALVFSVLDLKQTSSPTIPAKKRILVPYFLNIMVDTTIGVVVLYLFLKLVNYIFIKKCGYEGLQSGQYGDPPQFMPWFKQLLVYFLALSLMKACVVVLFQLWTGIYHIGDWLLSWLSDSVHAQVVFTMCIVPICMNVLQFLVIDSMIKAKNVEFELVPSDEESCRESPFSEDATNDAAKLAAAEGRKTPP